MVIGDCCLVQFAPNTTGQVYRQQCFGRILMVGLLYHFPTTNSFETSRRCIVCITRLGIIYSVAYIELYNLNFIKLNEHQL